jgi:hypothetical protein
MPYKTTFSVFQIFPIPQILAVWGESGLFQHQRDFSPTIAMIYTELQRQAARFSVSFQTGAMSVVPFTWRAESI